MSSLLQHFDSAGAKVTVSAARTGLTAGAVPPEDNYILSLEKLRGVTERARRAGASAEISVLAGTSLSELSEAVRNDLPGYFFPVDPTEQSASTGGAVALNAGGARSLRYGSMRNWVLGLCVVLPDGAVLRLRRGEAQATGGRFVLRSGASERTLEAAAISKPKTKNTIGYSYSETIDPIDLFIGSEGTLGIITEVTLGLELLPPLQLAHLQAFTSVEKALAAVKSIRSTLHPLAIELMDGRSLSRVANIARADLQRCSALMHNAAAALFIELPVEDEEELLTISEQLIEILIELGEDPDRSISGADDRTLAEIKAFRHAIPETVNATIAARARAHPGLHKLATDMAVQDDALEWVFQLYERELTASGYEFCIWGHAGNNHFHANILPRDITELERAKETYLELAKQIVKHGGAVAAEHGIGRLKQRFLEIQYSPAELENFRRIRRFFDPKGTLNTGVLI